MRCRGVRRSIAAIVLSAIVVAGCNRNSSSHEAATTASKSSTTVAADDVVTRPSKGCGTKPSKAKSPSTFTFEGVPHKYLVTLSRDYDAKRPAPLIFNFHGLGGSAAEQARLSGLDAEAAKRRYVTVTPTGSGRSDSAFWILPQFPRNDVPLYEALRTEIESTLCINRDRIYAAGISNGAAFASALACDPDSDLAAVASVSGLVPCSDSSAPIPIVAFHGTDDPVVPYDGGSIGAGLNRTGSEAGRSFTLPAVESGVKTWADHNRCEPDPIKTPVPPDVTQWEYEGCAAPVVFYEIEGGGHAWPGSDVTVPGLGLATQTIVANAIILDFFDEN